MATLCTLSRTLQRELKHTSSHIAVWTSTW